ncbi:hypothetical protein [Novosphingobium sp.]|uniref:hypothetical protein n=1 Tax=Novosphingobium sp. TaxID=1874826 RepID=UPI00260560EF|nr:hypothetical protein [Novosphingobium sp.]
MADLTVKADSVRSNPARPTRFEQAVQRYHYALNKLRTEPDDSDEANDLLADALCHAERGVMREPVANIEELRTKADIVFDALDSIPSDASVRSLFADLIRLTGGGPSRLFDPAYWLQRFERLGGGWVVRDDKVFLFWTHDKDMMSDWLVELEVRGGRPAVEALILARNEAREA